MFGVRHLANVRAPLSCYFGPIRVNSTSVQAQVKPKWDIVVSVCVERPPFITPPLSEMQNKMQKMLDEKELEQSMLNDHELRHKRDIERIEKKKKGEEVDDGEATITAMDMEDKWKKMAAEFTAASCTSEAEDNKDTRSVKRAMNKPLRLLTKYKLGTEIHWDVPFLLHTEGDTLRETAEKAVKQRVGDKLDVKVLGNAPLSFYKYKYPKHYQEKTDRIGAKVWFYKGIMLNGFQEDAPVILEEGLLDYQWATRTEMEEVLDKDLYRALDNMLHDEDD